MPDDDDPLWSRLRAASRGAELPAPALRQRLHDALRRRRRQRWIGAGASAAAALLLGAVALRRPPAPDVPALEPTAIAAGPTILPEPDVIVGNGYLAVRRPTKAPNVRLYELLPMSHSRPAAATPRPPHTALPVKEYES